MQLLSAADSQVNKAGANSDGSDNQPILNHNCRLWWLLWRKWTGWCDRLTREELLWQEVIFGLRPGRWAWISHEKSWGKNSSGSSWTSTSETNYSRVQIALLNGILWKLVVLAIILGFEYFDRNTIQQGIKHPGCCVLSGCTQQCLLPPECPCRPPIVPTTIGGISGMLTVLYFCHWCHRMV